MMWTKHPYYQEELAHACEYVKQELDGSSILITGATGLIGSFMVDTFMYYNNVHHGNIHVTCVGRNMERMKKRFIAYADHQELQFLELDLSTSFDLEGDYDYIIHGASNADPIMFAKQPVETIETNVNSTMILLKYLAHHQNSKMILMSSMEVYGEGVDLPYKEDNYGKVNHNKVRSCYPESKRMSELLCRCYTQEYNVQAVIARLSYIYGPSMTSTDSKASAQFLRNAVEQRDIVMKSSGLQKRSYCYVVDAVTGLLSALVKGTSGEAYNIANQDSIASVYEFAKCVANSAGVNICQDTPSQLEASGYSITKDDIMSADKLLQLGWKPSYSLEQGILHSIAILKEKPSC